MDKNRLIHKILHETGAEVFSLNKFPDNVKTAYISMIASLSWADGSIDDREKQILESIAKSAGEDIANRLEDIINETHDFSLDKYDNWVKEINDQPLKIALMVDMFLTAFSDTICMQSESIYMKYIAGKLGIDLDLYDVIRRNVEDYLKEKSGEAKPVTYEIGEAHKRENREETAKESAFRRFVNSIIKSLLTVV